MASIEDILAQYETEKNSFGDTSSIVDQYLALQGDQKKKDEGLDLLQPVRTAFSAFAAPGGMLAGQIAPEAYKTAEEEQRAALGVTDASPWYEKVEAMPGAGGTLVGAMSPEFKASGVGRIAAPITQIVGDMALDPTTYLGFGAKALAGGAARAAGAGKLMEAASAGAKGRAGVLAAAKMGGLEADAMKALQAGSEMERAREQAAIASHVLTQGTGFQKGAYKLGGFLHDAEPIAFAAPAALAYGPQTIASAYEQAKGIPESETPIADAASVALLSGMTLLMGKGLMSAGDALRTWQSHAQNKGFANDVIRTGEEKVIAAASELPEPQPFGPQPFIGPTEPRGFEMGPEVAPRQGPPRPPTGFDLVPEAAGPGKPPQGVMRIDPFIGKEPGIPEIDPNAVSLEADPIVEKTPEPEFIDPKAVRELKPLDNQVANFIEKNGGVNAQGMDSMLQRRFRAPLSQAKAWIEDAKIPKGEEVKPEVKVAATPEPATSTTPVPEKIPVPPTAERPLTDAEAARAVEEASRPAPGDETNPTPERVAEMMQPENRSGDSTPRTTVEPDEITALKLTDSEKAYLKDRVQTTGNEADAVKDILAQRAARNKTAPISPTTPESVAPKMLSQEDLPSPVKEATPQSTPEEAGQPPTPTKPVEAPTGTSKAAPEALSAEETKAFDAYKRTLETYPVDQHFTKEERAAAELIRQKKLEEAAALSDPAEIRKILDQNPVRPKKGRAPWRQQADNRPLGHVDRELGRLARVQGEGAGDHAAKVDSEKAVELTTGGKQKPLSPGQERDEAIAKLKAKHGSLRAWMDSPDSGPIFMPKSGREPINLRDMTRDEGKIWSRYVDEIDKGLSDDAARRVVIAEMNSTDARVGNIVRAGRKAAIEKGTSEVLTDAGREAPPKITEAEFTRLKTPLDAEATRLAEKLPQDLAGVDAQSKEFRGEILPLMVNYSRVMAQGEHIGAAAKVKNISALRALAKKIGLTEAEMGRKGTPELLQMIAEKVGLHEDFAQRLAANSEPIVKPLYDPHTFTVLHPGTTTPGGREGGDLHVHKGITHPDLLAGDIVKNGDINRVLVTGLQRGIRAVDAELEKHGITLERGNTIEFEAEDRESIQIYNVKRKPKPKSNARIDAQAARWEKRGISMDVGGETVVVHPDDWQWNLSDEDIADASGMIGPKFAQKLDIELRKRGIGGLDVKEFAQADKPDAAGGYHAMYMLPGATKQGQTYVIRVGRSPHIQLPTAAQRALVQPVLATGVLGRNADGVPYFWTLHQAGKRQMALEGVPLGPYGEAGQHLMKEKFRDADMNRQFDQGLFDGTEDVMQTTRQLPEGMSLQENFAYIRQLQQAIDAAGLESQDWIVGPRLRGSQMAWLDMTGQKVPDGAVVYSAKDAGGVTRVHQLVLTDFGTVYPNDSTIPKGSPWSIIGHNQRLALMEARTVSNAPDHLLKPRSISERLAQYEEDIEAAVKLGASKLGLVNHDRIMSGEYLEKYAALGEKPAVALKEFHDKLTKLVGLDTEFGGLTASPHLGGLYHQGDTGVGRIFTNLVESVNHAASYDEALDDMLMTMVHEVTHGKYAGHGTPFHDFRGYLESVAKSEGLFDEGRSLLRESFSEADYKRVQSELVPEFRSTRSKYGTVEAGRIAQDQREVSAGSTEGGTPSVADRRAGSTTGAEGDLRAGVRPGEAVQGSGQGQTGELRGRAATDRSAAAPSSEGYGTGSAARQGRGTEEGGVQRQPLTDEEAARVSEESRLQERVSRPRGKSNAQELMDTVLEEGKAGLRPVKDVYRQGWDLAGLYEHHMTDDERLETANSLPSPTKPGQNVGVLNLLNYPDMDLRMKARIAKWYEFTKGMWPRDKVEKWEDVGSDVQELFGTKTPEEWTRLFSTKGGGLTSHDVELLRVVNNELAGKLMTAEDRLFEALKGGTDAKTLQKLRDDISYQERAFQHSMFNTTRGLTGVARALAIARHEVRAIDPQLRMDQDMAAGLRERLKHKFMDKGEVEQKVSELMDKFHEIRKAKDGDWNEFYKAYNAMLGSKLWPDKILEFYKSGLLGWPSRVANISSNTLFRAVRYVEDAVAGAVDKAYSGITGTERSRYIGETSVSAMALQRALSESFGPWLKAQGDAFALRPDDVSKALAKGGLMEDMLQHPGAIEGKLGEFIRFSFKGLSSDDALAKHLSRTDNMYRQIYRKVRSGEYKMNTGETHTAATHRIYNDLQGNFDAALNGGQFEYNGLRHWQDMAAIAEEAARGDTFQTDLGNFGRGTNWLLRTVPALQIVFPFIRTPANIAHETIKRTPLGLIEIARKWKSLSHGERITELSKPAVGSLVGAGLLMKALDGSVTGGGPLDPDELEALKATGWQPYSVKIGDNWVSYQRFEPIAAIFGIAADSAEGMRNGDFQKWQTGAMRVFQSAAENITNKTFLSGLDGMFSAVSHPKQYLNRFTKQMQGSLIPNSLGFIPVSGLTRALDPTFRQTDPLSMSVFYAKLPFLSSTLDPQYGPTGDERQRPGSTLERALSPFARTTVKTGPGAVGADEVVRLSAAPKATNRYWVGRGGIRVDYTPEEKQKMAKAYRDATAVIGQRLVNDPSYKKLPDDEFDPNYQYGGKTKKDLIRKLYNGYRDRVMSEIKPSLERRAYAQITAQRRS